MIHTHPYRSSTLENWCREFARFVPSISIQTYYAGKDDRPSLRQTLIDTQRHRGKDSGWEVLITTYNLAQGDEKDRKFFRRIEWDVSTLELLKDVPLTIVVYCFRRGSCVEEFPISTISSSFEV